MPPQQIQFIARRRDDNFRSRQIRNQPRAHPFDRERVPVNEQNLFRRDALGKGNERFARGVSAKLKLLDVAMDPLRCVVRIDRYLLIR